MGPPFSLLPRPRWSRARGVENPRTARLVHHINSDGPLDPGGCGVAASFVLGQTPARNLSVLLHAPDARAHVELRALALEVGVAVDAAVIC